jgi:pimeloyl-ACP methyl ester carboxylesterase
MALLWAPFERGFGRTLLALFRGRPVDEPDTARWRQTLAAFEGPALVVWGARDPTFRVDRGVEIQALLKDCELVILEGSNHFVPIDRPRVLSRIVRRLLNDRSGP